VSVNIKGRNMEEKKYYHDEDCECIFCQEFPEEDETLFGIENNFPKKKDFIQELNE
jgi:hypothetical protein